jgi:hypothetical protein
MQGKSILQGGQRMYIQINKEGRERYKRKYFFPNAKGNSVSDSVRMDGYDAFYKKVTPGMTLYGKPRIAEFSCDELSILCYCPSCGLHFYGSWYNNEKFVAYSKASVTWDDTYFFVNSGITVRQAKELAQKETAEYRKNGNSAKIQAEIREFRSTKHCPLCGGSIIKGEQKHYEVSDYDFEKLCQKPQARIPELVEQSLCVAKSNATVTELGVDPLNVSDNVNLLQKYIKHILDTEATIQLLQRRLSALHYTAREYESSYIEQDIEKRSELAASAYKKLTSTPPTIADVKIEDSRPPKPSFTAKEPTKPAFVTVGFFNKKKALAENEALQAEYDRKLQKYKEEKAAYEEALNAWLSADTAFTNAKKAALEKLQEEYNERKKTERSTFAVGLEEKRMKILQGISDYALYQETMKEIHTTEALLAQAYGCLESLYNCGVIYEKYRDPVALASFYDYFASGRCATLTGPDGAYNLYESEVRMDLVITKLDVVIKKLEDIKKNQYMLYSVMSAMNQNLNELNRTASEMATSVNAMKCSVATIADNSAVIAHNTAVTAFYAKKNAELTNALGFMMALK